VQLDDASPLVASLALVEIVSLASLHQPFEPATAHAPVALADGATLSSFSVFEAVVVKPALSVAVIATVCVPCPTLIEPQAVETPSSVHEVEASPLVASLALVEIVSLASLHQPFEPATVQAPVALAVGAVVSIFTGEFDAVSVALLPATSVSTHCTVWPELSPVIENGEAYVAAAPESSLNCEVARPDVASVWPDSVSLPADVYQPFDPSVPE
jgi:hypothetical protein